MLLLSGAIGLGLWSLQIRHVLGDQYEHRALAIAESVATTPQIGPALQAGDPHHVINPLAEQIRAATGAAYVVVADRSGIRYSHPNPRLIGQSKEATGQVVTADGRTHVGVDHGSLGLSANGKAPIFGADHAVIGEVSVGVLEGTVSNTLWSLLPGLAGYLAAALLLGMAVAYLLARRLKRQTFGLELTELAGLVHEREATLHGIREGVLAVDRDGRLSLLNEQAHRLLGTTLADVGRPAIEVLAGSDVDRLLPHSEDAPDISDLVTVHAGRMLLGSRRRVREAGRHLGHVLTLRDRTELEQALRELDETRSLTDALRAQQHEFSNRMHVLAGLLDLGHVGEAASYAREVDTSMALPAALESQISDSRVTALIAAKATVARERGITLTVEAPTPIRIDAAMSDALVSIIGNLVDNAMDAVAGHRSNNGRPATITVRLTQTDDELLIDVEDTGPGIPAGAEEAIFSGGWSTKADGTHSRGIGLALVRQLTDALDGSVTVGGGAGARFRVRLPAVRSHATT